ncbi:MAG: hypothetical protein IT529_02295 [Burkholderiales bacterium]|nr:hypothetical protein [Burkholderiales bacterium]
MGLLAGSWSGPGARGAQAARKRLAVTLAVSVLCHASLTARTGTPRPRAPGGFPQVALSVRVEPVTGVAAAADPVAVTDPAGTASLAVPEPGARAAPARPAPTAAPAMKPAAHPDAAHGVSATGASALDTNWYTARELDVYPRPVSPAELDSALAGQFLGAAGRVLLWLRISERGEVVEVSAGGRATPATTVAAARAALSSVRFEPARKDERAVRSRILLSVSPAAGGGTRQAEPPE